MIFIIILVVLIVLFVVNKFKQMYIIKLFKNNSCMVYGYKGTGKDMLFQFVISRRKKEKYISNIDYGGSHIPLAMSRLNLGFNYTELYDGGKVYSDYYDYEGADVYISDVGVYLPSWDYSYLNKNYKGLPLYLALSRHLSNTNVHCNSQALNRPWDKLREQSGIYIKTLNTKVFLKNFVYTRVRVYDKYESALEDVRPLRLNYSGKEQKIEKDRFLSKYGLVKELSFVWYAKKINYDTRYFKGIINKID